LLSVLSIVLPIFALILAGWLCRRHGVLSAAAASELNRFVVYLALPALLFRIMAKSRWADLDHPGFIAAFGGGALALLMVTVLVRARSRALADAAIDGLNAAYPNAGFMGFPLCLLAFGAQSEPAVLIATILTACAVFAAALVLIEVGLHHGAGGWCTLRKISVSLARNPLLVAPALGACVGLAGVQTPLAVDRFLALLGTAASPCALVSLGLFLARPQCGDSDPGAVLSLVLVKLVVQPGLTWLLAFHVFSMPPVWAHCAVLVAALPMGTGPYMLAELYGREAAVTSRVILISTIGSLLSVALYLHFATTAP
jgi:malonate transporter